MKCRKLQHALDEEKRSLVQITYSLSRLCQVLEGDSKYAQLRDRLELQLKNQIDIGHLRKLRLSLYCSEHGCHTDEVIDLYYGFNEEDYDRK